MFNPDINDYQLTSIIAECCGGVAVVYSGVYKPYNQNVAIKRYFVDKDKEKASLIQQDILTRKELQHPNILPYLTSFVYGHELYVVSPLMNLGSCRDILDRHFQEGLPELACAIILRDVLLALQYLHKQFYIHRSIRASHVLLDTNGTVRLSGLRSAASMMVRGRRQKQLHSLPPPDHDNANLMWLSPELLEQNLKGYDEQSDIYSLGVFCCELANGAVPFSEVPTTLMFTEKVRGSRPQLLDCSSFPEPLDDGEMKSAYNTDSGVGDSAEGVSRVRAAYARRKLSDAFHHLSDQLLQRDLNEQIIMRNVKNMVDVTVNPIKTVEAFERSECSISKLADRNFVNQFGTGVPARTLYISSSPPHTSIDPEKRPSATQLLNHPFFKQIRRTDFLPSLIGRVKPIKPDPDDISALLLQEKISEMEIEKTTEWDF